MSTYTVTVRPYREADWDAVSRIHDTARRDELRGHAGADAFPPLAETYEDEGFFDGSVWVAAGGGDGDDGGEVLGFAALDDAELTWLYVDPARYRQGIGRLLLRRALADGGGSTVRCTVLDGNDAARALYESEGFVHVETRTGRLAGKVPFAATGHIMKWRRPGTA
ncbi:MAG TPA: GNAT family N-acetyltransferase [Streptomyces sp.]|nr:GNAT family N-acetyltransferase [Streptomyces sp.]